MTTVYLIRHSVRLPKSYIESYTTKQNKTILDEKIILNEEGEMRAKILSQKEELQNIDVIYASNAVRTLQTAKYMMESQNLKVNIDERLNERVVGRPNDDIYKDWYQRQYLDENYKTEGGESQKEVRERVEEAFDEIIKKNKNKRIAIFSHGYAITFFLLKYCKLISVEDIKLKYEYKGKILFDKIISAPEVFKLSVDGENVTNIELIEFEDLPYRRGI